MYKLPQQVHFLQKHPDREKTRETGNSSIWLKRGCKLRKTGKGDAAGQTQNPPEIIYLDVQFWVKKRKRVTVAACIPVTSLQKNITQKKGITPSTGCLIIMGL